MWSIEYLLHRPPVDGSIPFFDTVKLLSGGDKPLHWEVDVNEQSLMTCTLFPADMSFLYSDKQTKTKQIRLINGIPP